MSSETPPWKSGIWYNENLSTQLMIMDGEKMELKNLISLDYPDAKPMMTGVWTLGDFGPAKQEIVEKTGVQNYNLQMDNLLGKVSGVLNENGTQIDIIGFSKDPEIITLLSPEELEKVKENRDSAEAPSISYFEPQPDSPGKLIWLSGPPGAGKSTSGMLLGRDHGFVYYEADAFGMFANPFVDPNVAEPTLQVMKQKPLKGVSKECVDALNSAAVVFEDIQKSMEFKDEHFEGLDPMFEVMAKDIILQRKRLGGSMAIAQAIHSSKQREKLRKMIGPELVFIVLTMSKECQMKRIKARHGDDFPESFMNLLIKAVELYEPAGAEEENAFNVVITEDDSREDVVEKIVDILKSKC